MDSARHVITRVMNPRLLGYMASYDVASTIHQSLDAGPGFPASTVFDDGVGAFDLGMAVQFYPIITRVEGA